MAINPQFFKLKNLRMLYKGMTEQEKRFFDVHVDTSPDMIQEMTLSNYKGGQPLSIADVDSPLMKAVLGVIKGSQFAGNVATLGLIPYANNLADFLNVMGRTDKFNRRIAYAIALNTAKIGTKGIDISNLTKKDISRLTNKTGLLMLREPQRKESMRILATEGIGGFQRYIAKEVTITVNFEYRRRMRGPAEQGSVAARIMSNLLTFGKGRLANMNNALRLVGEGFRDSKGKDRTKRSDRYA